MELRVLRMNKFRLILAMVLSVLWGGAAELDYQIGENGRLTVTLDGAVLFGDEELLLMDVKWQTVSAPLAAPAVMTNAGVVQTVCWTAGRGEAGRSVEKLADGRLRINWKISFPNDIPEGRFVELSYRGPTGMFRYPEGGEKRLGFNPRKMTLDTAAGPVELSFRGLSLPWAFEDLRGVKWHRQFRLILALPYDPDAVNEAESEITIGVRQKNDVPFQNQ